MEAYIDITPIEYSLVLTRSDGTTDPNKIPVDSTFVEKCTTLKDLKEDLYMMQGSSYDFPILTDEPVEICELFVKMVSKLEKHDQTAIEILFSDATRMWSFFMLAESLNFNLFSYQMVLKTGAYLNKQGFNFLNGVSVPLVTQSKDATVTCFDNVIHADNHRLKS